RASLSGVSPNPPYAAAAYPMPGITQCHSFCVTGNISELVEQKAQVGWKQKLVPKQFWSLLFQ
ncbi:MAG: hypothetical protein ACRD4F_16490, partial [Candidatus Angelobacter sp.]